MKPVFNVPESEYDFYSAHINPSHRFTCEDAGVENLVFREGVVTPAKDHFYEGMSERTKTAWNYMLEHLDCRLR